MRGADQAARSAQASGKRDSRSRCTGSAPALWRMRESAAMADVETFIRDEFSWSSGMHRLNNMLPFPIAISGHDDDVARIEMPMVLIPVTFADRSTPRSIPASERRRAEPWYR